MAEPDLEMREPLVLSMARDGVLIGEDLIDFLLTVERPVQLAKRVVRELRTDGEDPFVLCRADVIRWSTRDPTNRRVVR